MRKEEHKSQIGPADDQQSRSIHQTVEESENAEMSPKGNKSTVTKPSPKKVAKKLKVLRDESLKGRLECIMSAKTEEYNSESQRKAIKEWGITEKNVWGASASMLLRARILTYLGAPQVAKMGNLKDLASKYIISRFHDGKLWLDHPVEITENLIHHITGLPIKGEKVPMENPSAELL